MNWINARVQGVMLGGVYALFACGLSLMFGVMRTVNLSQERGLIERAHAPGKRRIMEARLTREGEELLAACAPAVQKLEDRLLLDIPENRRSAFRQGLEAGLASLTGRHHG
ncbi:hypothetical protein [Streptomyces sp. NPDC005476]|uniref:hypothetical protein n=1 Tax=Streptomyces sp. NPDC005476 TaxID=3156882 RepID=UPI00345504E1